MSARHTWGAPPGASSSAHSTDSVQVTAIAADAAVICSRRLMYRSW